MTKRAITLALGGGGARGLAHLGVMEVLEQNGYEFSRIVGVSMGSLVGALRATGEPAVEIQKKALTYLLSKRFQEHQQTLFGMTGDGGGQETSGYFSWYYRIQQFLRANSLFRRIIAQPGMLPGVLLEDVVEHLLDDRNIEDLPIPFSAVAVDLNSGHQVILEKGSIKLAVRGSSSLPGIFPPVAHGNMLLCDTGTFCSLPARIAQSYNSGPVIAVEVSTDVIPGVRITSALDALIRVDEIGENYWRKHVRHHADYLIQPEVSRIPWYDFSAAERLIEQGRAAARISLHAIDRLLDGKSKSR